MLDTTKFDRLCEQAITNTTKMFYPRNLKFSDKFLAAFREEYNNQKKMVIEDKGHKAFGNHFERMLKGLRFEAKKIDDENKPKSKKPKLVEAKKPGPGQGKGFVKGVHSGPGLGKPNAHTKGVLAAKNGSSMNANPFPQGTKPHQEWKDGYRSKKPYDPKNPYADWDVR